MLKKITNNPLPFLILTLLVVVPFITLNLVNTQKILGAKDTLVSVPPSPEPTPVSSPLETVEENSHTKLSKSSYSVALFGDSMIDTMGDLKFLSDALLDKYPEVKFTLYNYGIGSQNIKQGFERLNLAYSYHERNYTPITSVKPDVIILGTFAYNPFDPHNPSTYKSFLSSAIKQLKETTPNVYVLLEIAPLGENFGKGEKGVNLGPEYGIAQSKKINEQMELASSVAQSLGVPTIDVFSKTKGRQNYTSPDDGIHPSYDGFIFTSNLIAQTILLK